MVSNRGPVEYHVSREGQLTEHRGRGGLVTALSAVSHYTGVTWIAAALTEGDRRVAQQRTRRDLAARTPGEQLNSRFVVIPPDAYRKYYDTISNPLLWFLQHYMWNSPITPDIDETTYDAWHSGYVEVNRQFAEAVLQEIAADEPKPFVMLQDYHLYLAAGQIRAQAPGAILQHFTHIPWPAAGYWELLPQFMRQAIFAGLCANDIVGLQTRRYAQNFLHACEFALAEAEIDYNAQTVWYRGHLTRVRAYPISIDVAEVQRVIRSAPARTYQEQLQRLTGSYTIVRVDRVDPSKNILRGFKAFDLFLRRHPELVGKVRFLAFLVPSRTSIPEYKEYAEQIMQLVRAVNARYGSPDWQPISVFYENNYAQALAALSLADAVLVNPVIDGMNLVAKEACIVNQRDAVLVLSESAGSYDQLREGVLGVAPADVEGTARALHAALTMPAAERRERAVWLREQVEREDLAAWLYRQFDDLLPLA